jgi:SAM-dependent methyltransferase
MLCTKLPWYVKIARVMAKFWREHEIIAKYAKGKILDVGFAQKPNRFLKGYVVGLDIKLPKEKPKNYTKMIRCDAQKMSEVVKEKFDTVVASNLIEHLENVPQFLRECNKVLNKDGLLIISTDNPYRWQTLLGNMLFIKGKHFGDEHINYWLPWMLNRQAAKYNFILKNIVRGEGLPTPLFTEKWIYVYQKESNL